MKQRKLRSTPCPRAGTGLATQSGRCAVPRHIGEDSSVMQIGSALAILTFLTSAGSSAQERLPTRSFLGDLPGVVDVVVVSSAGQIDTQEVRDAARERLKKHGLLVEWVDGATEQPRLVIEVEAFHDTPSKGAVTHHTYYVEVRLKEPVTTERGLGTLFLGTTWFSRSRIATFGAEVDKEPIVDSIIQGLDSFIRDVLLDRQVAR
jgi:hypothetical protein